VLGQQQPVLCLGAMGAIWGGGGERNGHALSAAVRLLDLFCTVFMVCSHMQLEQPPGKCKASKLQPALVHDKRSCQLLSRCLVVVCLLQEGPLTDAPGLADASRTTGSGGSAGARRTVADQAAAAAAAAASCSTDGAPGLGARKLRSATAAAAGNTLPPRDQAGGCSSSRSKNAAAGAKPAGSQGKQQQRSAGPSTAPEQVRT
jgi:hypothetical protein